MPAGQLVIRKWHNGSVQVILYVIMTKFGDVKCGGTLI